MSRSEKDILSSNLFRDAMRYDDMFRDYKDDLEFWNTCISKQRNPRVLELACGTGRISEVLANSGISGIGIDISPEFCETAMQKVRGLPAQWEFLLADMRSFDLQQKFDVIFIGFNSFLHLLTNEDAETALQCVKKHLAKGAEFWIDVFMPHPDMLYDGEEPEAILRYFDRQKNANITLTESRSFNAETEIITVNWQYSQENEKAFMTQQFQMRAFYPDTMNRLLTDSGFNVEYLFGDYDESPFNSNSTLQIYCLK